jgi:catechol 2,3-dioxygenase-like lactoylglutathione lyase family enzyme
MALRRLDHLLVLTDDVEATKAFYCDGLGLEVGERPPLGFPGLWLYLDGVPCVHVAERGPFEEYAARLGWEVRPAPVDHVAFQAEDAADVEARLQAAGVDVVANPAPPPGLRQLFLTDPNGLRVEVNARTGTPSPSPGR